MELMPAVLERGNLMRAYERVLRNKGAPGVDGMTVAELKPYLKTHWPAIREQLRVGRYRPSPVRKVELPKPGGGKRMLGIPTVLDRLIQQALHQILSPVFEPTFSSHSYGFRPGRSAAQAVQQARTYVEEGHRWVVDADLEQFFDRVNHDILMSRVARQVKDKRVLKLIRSYLQAGIMEGGVATARTEGTPQGGPLSPLLSNILLNDLDRELERRGHRFCRYADDSNVYVKSKRAGERVLASMTNFLETRLKLRVNREKSAVDRPWKRSFLGYTVCQRKYNVRLKVAAKPTQRLKANLKELFRTGRGRSIRTTIYQDHHRRSGSETAGLGHLLPPCGGEGDLRGTGRLDTPSPAQDSLAAMAAPVYPGAQADASRTLGGARVDECHQRAWPLVELWCLAHESRAAHAALRSARTGIADGPIPSAQLSCVHRRGTEPYARWCERTAGVTPPPTRSGSGRIACDWHRTTAYRMLLRP